MDLQTKHEKLLYPVVRVNSVDPKGNKAAGSGTVIYSEPDPENSGKYFNFVLTNHHVIDSLILLKSTWDSVLKKERKKEFFTRPEVEIFDYVDQSTIDSSNSGSADIVAYSVEHDLALLKLTTARKLRYVAPLLPEDKIKDLRLFMPIAVSGCSMAHQPFVNLGELTFLTEDIENHMYFMYNAGSYFGNSGGALFLADTGELIGVPSRITTLPMGFSMDMVTFMGFGAHTSRLYAFIRHEHMNFLIDSTKTWKNAVEDREKAEKRSVLQMQIEATRELEKK